MDFKAMITWLPEEKLQKTKLKYLEFYWNYHVCNLELTKVPRLNLLSL